MWQADYDHAGFSWIDCTDTENSVLSFYRQTSNGSDQVVVIMNLTPVPRGNYRVGLPRGGFWREVLNSDAGIYGGSNKGNLGGINADGAACHGQPHSAEFYLPPMSVIVFRNEK